MDYISLDVKIGRTLRQELQERETDRQRQRETETERDRDRESSEQSLTESNFHSFRLPQEPPDKYHTYLFSTFSLTLRFYRSDRFSQSQLSFVYNVLLYVETVKP